MAIMIPDLLPDQIANDGEREFYKIASRLPDEYTVCYSHRYYESPEDERVREADFVIVHRDTGFVVVEVKEGEVAFANGQWHEFKSGGYLPMPKDPVEQARTAMFELIRLYREAAKKAEFPGKYRFALCFPESRRISGRLPANVIKESIWTGAHLEDLEGSLERLWGGVFRANHEAASAVRELLDKVLAPRCRIFASLEDKIVAFQRQAELVLTEEQQRILDETEEDRRKLFLGAAGTGKTFIAMEKARRSAAQGKKVLLTCFNKNLVQWLKDHVSHPLVTINHFHGFLTQTLLDRQVMGEDEVRDDPDFYQHELPDRGFTYFSDASDAEKFQVIIVDEGQDFQDHWFTCLEAMLVPDGEIYIFADPNQNLFQGALDKLRARYDLSRHRLTYNLRNADTINEWLRPYAGDFPVRSRLSRGVPVTSLSWATPEQQKRMLEREIGRLISGGLPLHRILILSPFRRENGGLKDVDRIGDWPVIDLGTKGHGIRYATIRSFKGLESDIVFLIDVRDSKACTSADIYVGASRAKYMLYVLHHEAWRGAGAFHGNRKEGDNEKQ